MRAIRFCLLVVVIAGVSVLPAVPALLIYPVAAAAPDDDFSVCLVERVCPLGMECDPSPNPIPFCDATPLPSPSPPPSTPTPTQPPPSATATAAPVLPTPTLSPVLPSPTAPPPPVPTATSSPAPPSPTVSPSPPSPTATLPRSSPTPSPEKRPQRPVERRSSPDRVLLRSTPVASPVPPALLARCPWCNLSRDGDVLVIRVFDHTADVTGSVYVDHRRGAGEYLREPASGDTYRLVAGGSWLRVEYVPPHSLLIYEIDWPAVIVDNSWVHPGILDCVLTMLSE